MTHSPDLQPGFTADRVGSYDERVRKHIPGYEILHQIAETMLALELGEQASLLVVGTGTGQEIMEWAPKHPGWRFLGTDTAQAMLALAEEKARAASLAARARFHAGPVDALEDGPFDAATLMLVLHFVPDGEKGALLDSIAERLVPGAPFLIASLFGDPDSTRFARLNAARKAWTLAKGVAPELAAQFCDPKRPDMHIVPEERIKGLLREAGFIDIQRVFQATTVGLWFARRAR